jgi:predicted NUDIX family NTP pyrophosphohydrolase
MSKRSAGILVFRKLDNQVEVLIAHPGGPCYIKKDNGYWTIPKGLYDDDEEPMDAAKREYEEEIGLQVPEGELIDLGEIKRSDGKFIKAWAVEGEVDTTKVKSNTFKLEWPPKSGKKIEVPEIDRAEWYELAAAIPKLQSAQVVFLERLAAKLNVKMPDAPDESQQQLL